MSIRAVNAHVAGHGPKLKVFEQVGEVFIMQIPQDVLKNQQISIEKSLKERFNKLVEQRRHVAKSYLSASRLSEVVTEKVQLLDNITLEMEEKDEAVKKERKEQTEAEKLLVSAG